MIPATSKDEGVPLIPIEALAGFPINDNIGIAFIDCEHYIVPEFQSKGVEFMIRVSGSSMYPKYSNGDILACRRIKDILFFQWGKIYVIDSSQGVLVKRIFEDSDPDNILLISDNKEKYPPFSFPKSDIRSLSIVLGVIRME
jgi:phage repressor protein C with HTH and peptisase S24 domain